MTQQPEPRPVDRALKVFGDARAGEGETVLLMAFNVFVLLVAYYVLKTVREPLILASGGHLLRALRGHARGRGRLRGHAPGVAGRRGLRSRQHPDRGRRRLRGRAPAARVQAADRGAGGCGVGGLILVWRIEP